MKKIYVLDTNILLHNSRSIYSFQDNDIVLPMAVIEELDGKKKGLGHLAFCAREALRILDECMCKADIFEGVDLGNGGRLIVMPDCDNEFTRKCSDNRIISTGLHLKAAQDRSMPVILVSKDTTVRIKAKSLGLEAQDYKNDKTDMFTHYGRVLSENDYTNGIRSIRYRREGNKLFRLWGKDQEREIKRLKDRSVQGITPKNIEQEALLDALLCPDISVVAVSGPAGTGKTLIGLAAGLELIQKSKEKKGIKYPPAYRYTPNIIEQIYVTKPIIPIGNELGFLPGDLSEKLNPWMAPVFDNLRVLTKGAQDGTLNNAKALVDKDIVHIEALTFIRGRSIPGVFYIVEEAQNLRPTDIKTLLTRAGEGSKYLLVGDMKQIDTPYLDERSCGLAHIIGAYMQEEDFCYLHLTQSVRSSVAEKAARLL